MHLQAQVLATNGVKEVKADGILRTKAAIVAQAKQLDGLIEHEVLRRNLHAHLTKAQIQAVLLGYTVEGPRIVVSASIEVANVLHPLPTPDARVKVGHKTEGTTSHGA